MTSRTNDSLTLNTAHLTRDSCIQIGPKRTNGSDECIPTTRSFIPFENLNSSTLYDVFLFSYFNVSNVTRVYSNASCLLGKTYTCKLQNNSSCFHGEVALHKINLKEVDFQYFFNIFSLF